MSPLLATSSFLEALKAVYPKTSPVNPWYIVAAVGFSACNRPEEIPLVFEHTLKDISSQNEKLLLARRLRDALFKSGMLTGFNKVLMFTYNRRSL
jgi:hypothetical protein